MWPGLIAVSSGEIRVVGFIPQEMEFKPDPDRSRWGVLIRIPGYISGNLKFHLKWYAALYEYTVLRKKFIPFVIFAEHFLSPKMLTPVST